jgi:NADP-dependent 3-hydroxy acid dehydrogenase YdfG
MPVIAIVGAGPGLGLSIAKVFGRHGYQIALISRNETHLAGHVATLSGEGITAEGFAADASSPESLSAALGKAADRFGGIDVLEFSPIAGLAMTDPVTLTVDDLRAHVETLLYGAVSAAQAVLPGMIARGEGTLLFTGGGGSISPYPMLAGVNAAQAATRNYARNLHNVLADKGVYVAHVAISILIAAESPEGYPHAHPDDIAAIYWDLHAARTEAERTFPA